MPDTADALTQRTAEKTAAVESVTFLNVQPPPPAQGLPLPTNGLSDGLVRSMKGAREDITGAVSTKLTNVLFSTGAKDQLSLIDVYGLKNNDTINTFAETLKGIAGAALDSFRMQGLSNILGNIGNFSNVLSQVTNGFNLNPQAMAERITSCIGQSSVINQLTGDMKNAISSANQILPNLASTVYTVVDNVVNTSVTNNVRDAQDLFSIVNQITNDNRLSGVVDMGAQCAIYSGVVNQAIKLNMPNCLDTLATQTVNPDVIKIAMQANAVDAIMSGNIDMVNQFSTSLGAGPFMRDIPNAAPLFAQSYKSPTVVAEADLGTEWTALESTLNSFDPDWATAARNGENVSNLAVFTNASPDAKRLMSQDPTLATAILISDKYPSVDLMKDLKSKYPKAGVA